MLAGDPEHRDSYLSAQEAGSERQVSPLLFTRPVPWFCIGTLMQTPKNSPEVAGGPRPREGGEPAGDDTQLVVLCSHEVVHLSQLEYGEFLRGTAFVLRVAAWTAPVWLTLLFFMAN